MKFSFDRLVFSPRDIDLVIVPRLGFKQSGFRIAC